MPSRLICRTALPTSVFAVAVALCASSVAAQSEANQSGSEARGPSSSGEAAPQPSERPKNDDRPSGTSLGGPDQPRSAPQAESGETSSSPTSTAGEGSAGATGGTGGEGATAAPVDLTAASSHVMKNNLEIVMQPIPGAPEVTVCTAIEAGSRLDPRNAPGAYRILGEMLKEGGYRSSQQDYVALVKSRGGKSSVEVTRDATTFCTTVPAGELPLALWVSAGRFTSGTLTETSLKKAVDRLAKESELADAQVRTGRAPERLRKMAFLGTYEYSHPTLPNPDDLDAVGLNMIRRLHRESYVARRAKLAISGAFSEDKAIERFSEHLFAARPGKKIRYRLPALVAQTTARFSMAEDRSAKTPAAWYGWVAPADDKRIPMEIALSTLVSNQRLGGQLVGRGRAAKTMDLFLDEGTGTKGYALPRLEIVGSSSRSLGTIEKGFDDHLKKLATGALSADEILETQRRLRTDRAAKLSSSEQRARAMARGVLFGVAAKEVLAPLDESAPFPEITVDAVRHAALSLLNERRRSAIEIYPKGWQDPWQEPMRRFHIVSKGETLGSIARRYGTTVPVITKMNSMRKTKTIYPGDKLRVPRGKTVKSAKKPRTHKVRRGDTLSGLALKYGVSQRAIADANGMGAKLTIRTGETLQIPWPGSKTNGPTSSKSSKTPAPAVMTTYKVKSGDTLSQIAARKGVSTVALARANGISHKAMVRVGQTLKVPARGTGRGPAPKPVTYKVKKGDTLSGIAKKHGVSVASITVANGISRKKSIRPGQVLTIPAKK